MDIILSQKKKKMDIIQTVPLRRSCMNFEPIEELIASIIFSGCCDIKVKILRLNL